MKVITCLGVGPYDRVTYVWHNRTHTTELFPEALGIWLREDITEMLVLLTDAARRSVPWRNLQVRLAGKVQLNNCAWWNGMLKRDKSYMPFLRRASGSRRCCVITLVWIRWSVRIAWPWSSC